MDTEINPYQPPESPAEEADVDRKARNLVHPLTLGLIVLSGMVVAGGLLAVPMAIVAYFMHRRSSLLIADSPAQLVENGLYLIGNIAFCTGSALALYGAWQMRRFRSRRWAYAAAILALVPSPFFIVTAPFGVWSLIVLRKPVVKEAFARQQNKQGVPDNGVGTP